MATRKNEAIWIEKNKRWQIKVQKDGERRAFNSFVPGKKGKIETEKKADQWLASGMRNENIRFVKLWENFLEEVHKTTSTATYKQHEYIGRVYLLPTLKNKRAVSITPQDWQNCINIAYRKGLAKKTCKNIRGSITALCRYARKCRIVIEKPDDLIIPRDAPVKEKNILQPADINKLFTIDHVNMYGKPKPCFFIYSWRFIVLTGLRRGELCGLKNEDIEGDILHIRRSINRYNEETQGKNANARRYMILSEHAKKVLEQQQALLKANDIISPWLFPDEEGGRLNPQHLFSIWNTYRKQQDINCTIHEMRHTMISIAKADVPEQLLKQVVGHSQSMDTFGIYGHEVEGELKRVANILDGVFDTLLR